MHKWVPCHREVLKRSHVDKTIYLLKIENKYVPIVDSAVKIIEPETEQQSEQPGKLSLKSMMFWSLFFKSMDISTSTSDCLSIYLSFRLCVCFRKLAPFPAVVWRNVTNKGWFECVTIEKYAFLVNFSSLLSMRLAKPKHFCVLAHLVCIHEAVIATSTSY